MSAEPADVTLSVDGTEVTVPAGTLIIRAAEQLGIEIPRFCEHPLLEPVGACRQCYVQVEGQPKLTTSCTVPVAPGMKVRTQASDEVVAEAQRANLEFLLLNHPLDCPICDRGGECPLQDQALAYGPGDSRFREAKRVFKKPIPVSPSSRSTASGACCARGARGSATRSPATGSSRCSSGAPGSGSRSRRGRTSGRRSAATRSRSARSAP